MMTAYVADYEISQGNISKADMTKVSKNAWAQNPEFNGSSLMWLEAGKMVSVADLLKGVTISSGNDATVALAEHIAGSSNAFVDIMNQHAQLLGMKDSYFENPHGLPAPNHSTTARDMATLAQAIIRDFPEEYKLYAEKSFTYNGIKQPNRNKLLWRDPTVDGLKTGYTRAAGYCLVASAKKDDMRLISVVMGANSTEGRAQESQKLLSFGFRYYQTLKLYSQGEVLSQSKVYSGVEDVVNVIAKDDVYVTVPRSQRDKVMAEMDLEKYLQAPLVASQVVGDIVVSLNGEVLSRQAISVEQAVDQGGLFTRLWDAIALFFIKLMNG
jgi:D-alanyl-D-alanine carboxypeptidase (penicillin-binding protein 5/6)